MQTTHVNHKQINCNNYESLRAHHVLTFLHGLHLVVSGIQIMRSISWVNHLQANKMIMITTTKKFICTKHGQVEVHLTRRSRTKFSPRHLSMHLCTLVFRLRSCMTCAKRKHTGQVHVNRPKYNPPSHHRLIHFVSRSAKNRSIMQTILTILTTITIIMEIT